MAPQTVKVKFTWDDGYGTELECRATVDLDYDKAKVLDLEVDTMHGGEPSAHAMKCIEEKAVEKAFDAVEAGYVVL
jgi:hypothetical protein